MCVRIGRMIARRMSKLDYFEGKSKKLIGVWFELSWVNSSYVRCDHMSLSKVPEHMTQGTQSLTDSRNPCLTTVLLRDGAIHSCI